jgi:hypothetical protein
MKQKMTLAKVLSNKTVLNIVFVIALIMVVGYLMIGDIQSVVLFILSVLSISYFSKNMIVVLGVSILLVSLFSMRNKRIEGMETKKKVVAEKKSDDESVPKHAIDKDATQSAAYSELEDTIGSDGVKKMANDTSSLVTQQRELMGNMKDVEGMMDKVEPMMARLEGMMDKLNSFGSGGNLGGMMKKMKK